jgi:hypothetical protein
MRMLLLSALLGATVVPQTLDQLTDRADVVVRATVLAQRAERGDGPGGIYTYTRLQVAEALKGAPAGEVVVRQVGGTVGDSTLDLPGDARLAVGEQALLFLRCRPERPFCTVVGLAQGKYHLDPDGRATRDFAQTAFVQGAPLSGAPAPYAELAQRVRARAGGAR